MISSELYNIFLKCNGISTDTRNIQKDSLFFSLKGENFDGNDYALDALNKGAKFAVIDNKNLSNPKFICVDNALVSLQKLSSFHRLKLKNTKIIAITGSNGKTTTKELIHSVLCKKYKTISTIGNLNNHIGVPLTLLSIKIDSDFAIVEMGANHIGEIKFLTDLIKPNIGYITNFGKAHLEGFGDLNGVIKGKTELYNWLIKNNKPILINSNDEIQCKFLNNKSITFGTNNTSNYVFEKETNENFVSVIYKKAVFFSNLIGNYNFNNISAAISLGIHFKLNIKTIQEAILGYIPKNNRSQLLNVNDKKIIMDAYNANPSSMQLAIDSFMKFSGSKIMILADMFELGKYTKNEHKQIIKQSESKNIKTFFVGENFYKLKKQSKLFSFFRNREDLIKEIKKNKIEENNILVKGSRGMKMELLIHYLK